MESAGGLRGRRVSCELYYSTFLVRGLFSDGPLRTGYDGKQDTRLIAFRLSALVNLLPQAWTSPLSLKTWVFRILTHLFPRTTSLIPHPPSLHHLSRPARSAMYPPLLYQQPSIQNHPHTCQLLTQRFQRARRIGLYHLHIRMALTVVLRRCVPLLVYRPIIFQ